MPVSRPLVERFWEKVNKDGPTQPHMDSPCWLWTAARNSCGYGSCGYTGRTTERAHRVAAMLTLGPIPQGAHVLHRCDVRLCVRPEHLYFGTNNDNIADRVRRGRSVGGNGDVGERHYLAKLTADAVRFIRASTETDIELARRFGVSDTSVYNARMGRTWKSVVTDKPPERPVATACARGHTRERWKVNPATGKWRCRECANASERRRNADRKINSAAPFGVVVPFLNLEPR